MDYLICSRGTIYKKCSPRKQNLHSDWELSGMYIRTWKPPHLVRQTGDSHGWNARPEQTLKQGDWDDNRFMEGPRKCLLTQKWAIECNINTIHIFDDGRVFANAGIRLMLLLNYCQTLARLSRTQRNVLTAASRSGRRDVTVSCHCRALIADDLIYCLDLQIYDVTY